MIYSDVAAVAKSHTSRLVIQTTISLSVCECDTSTSLMELKVNISNKASFRTIIF